jgi:hypothetical protein
MTMDEETEYLRGEVIRLSQLTDRELRAELRLRRDGRQGEWFVETWVLREELARRDA